MENISEFSNINQAIALLGILSFGFFALYRTFGHMKKGFGVFNVRIIGIIIVATMTSILGILNPNSFGATMGILGAIAGYLFGFGGSSSSRQTEHEDENPKQG